MIGSLRSLSVLLAAPLPAREFQMTPQDLLRLHPVLLGPAADGHRQAADANASQARSGWQSPVSEGCARRRLLWRAVRTRRLHRGLRRGQGTDAQRPWIRASSSARSPCSTARAAARPRGARRLRAAVHPAQRLPSLSSASGRRRCSASSAVCAPACGASTDYIADTAFLDLSATVGQAAGLCCSTATARPRRPCGFPTPSLPRCWACRASA